MRFFARTGRNFGRTDHKIEARQPVFLRLLKIIAAILAVVFLLIVFFTTIKTRARSEQEFIVYAYSTTKSVSGGDADMTLLSGEDTSTFADDLLGSGALSYDVLSVEFENFGSDQYSETLFSSRAWRGWAR